MGKRKSSKPPPKKEVQKVPTIFNCPFCNHEATVEARLDRVAGIGTVSCRICNEEFRTTIDNLSEAVDVYSEWVDEAARVNNSS